MDFAVPRTASPFQNQGLDPTQFTPTRWQQLQNPLSPAKWGEMKLFLWIAALSLLFQSWSHIQRLSTPSLGGSAIQKAPGDLAGSGASSCALKKVMRRLLVFNGKRISPALLPSWKELCLPWDIWWSQGFHNAGKASPGFSTQSAVSVFHLPWRIFHLTPD